jgi:hypothetical protein
MKHRISNTKLHSNVYRGGEEEATQHSLGRRPTYRVIRRGADNDVNKGK